jgi:hypothetical protein
MRFSNKDVNTKRDGLTPEGMGIKGIGGFMVRNFMKPEDSKKFYSIQIALTTINAYTSSKKGVSKKYCGRICQSAS